MVTIANNAAMTKASSTPKATIRGGPDTVGELCLATWTVTTYAMCAMLDATNVAGRRERKRQPRLDRLPDTLWELFVARCFGALAMDALGLTEPGSPAAASPQKKRPPLVEAASR